MTEKIGLSTVFRVSLSDFVANEKKLQKNFSSRLLSKFLSLNYACVMLTLSGSKDSRLKFFNDAKCKKKNWTDFFPSKYFSADFAAEEIIRVCRSPTQHVLQL